MRTTDALPFPGNGRSISVARIPGRDAADVWPSKPDPARDSVRVTGVANVTGAKVTGSDAGPAGSMQGRLACQAHRAWIEP